KNSSSPTRKTTPPVVVIPASSTRAPAQDAGFEELHEDPARVEARHVARGDDLAHRALAVDRVEDRLLFRWQRRLVERREREVVLHEDAVEAPDRPLEDAPLVDTAEAFHHDRRDREAEARR